MYPTSRSLTLAFRGYPRRLRKTLVLNPDLGRTIVASNDDSMRDENGDNEDEGMSTTKKVAAGAALGVAIPAAVGGPKKLIGNGEDDSGSGDDSEGGRSTGARSTRSRRTSGSGSSRARSATSRSRSTGGSRPRSRTSPSRSTRGPSRPT